MALIRLIADLEDKKREEWVLFTARFDAEYDEDTIAYVANKFNVAKFRTHPHAIGWPAGPNQLMAQSYKYIVDKVKRGRFPGTDAILLVESDAIPLRKSWIDEIYAEFKGSGRLISGPYFHEGDGCDEHINGNCVFSIDLYTAARGLFNPPNHLAWDFYMRYELMQVGHHSRLIWSDYRLGTEKNPWRGDDYLWDKKYYGGKNNPLYGIPLQPAYFHGIKGMMGIDAVRKKLLLNES